MEVPKMQGLPNTDRVSSEGEESSSYGAFSKEDNSITSSTSHRTATALSVSDDVENRYFGQSENRNVRNVKALVFLVLFLVTLAVCLAVYFVTANGQQDEFEAS
jgi:hypothetical protein